MHAPIREGGLTLALYLTAFLLGLGFRQIMRFQEAQAEIALNMSIAQNSKLPPGQYQNSITPPWLSNLWLIIVLALVTCAALAWHLAGLRAGVMAVLCFLAGMLVSGMSSMVLSRPTLKTYCRVTYRSLLNREADYRKGGDHMRGDAIRQFRELLEMVVGPSLTK